jgi:hypothetical protein
LVYSETTSSGVICPSRSIMASLTLFGPKVSNPRRESVREEGDDRAGSEEETCRTSYLQA